MQPWTTPTLGYGCARLLARADRRRALHLLDAVLESGIRHIDVGRSYGEGRAESVVGDIARRNRQSIIIVTKAGINPPSTIRRAVRKVIGPAFRGSVPAPHQPGKFAPEQIAMSVLRSLRALRVQHIDALLLHECELQHLTDDLLEMLQRMNRDGFIGAYGIATTLQNTRAILRQRPEFCSVVQIADPGVAPLLTAPGHLVTHSVLAGSTGATSPSQRLLSALQRNAQGTVLFSSGNPLHIRENAAMWRRFIADRSARA